jgi:hypothetical protein
MQSPTVSIYNMAKNQHIEKIYNKNVIYLHLIRVDVCHCAPAHRMEKVDNY